MARKKKAKIRASTASLSLLQATNLVLEQSGREKLLARVMELTEAKKAAYRAMLVSKKALREEESRRAKEQGYLTHALGGYERRASDLRDRLDRETRKEDELRRRASLEMGEFDKEYGREMDEMGHRARLIADEEQRYSALYAWKVRLEADTERIHGQLRDERALHQKQMWELERRGIKDRDSLKRDMVEKIRSVKDRPSGKGRRRKDGDGGTDLCREEGARIRSRNLHVNTMDRLQCNGGRAGQLMRRGVDISRQASELRGEVDMASETDRAFKILAIKYREELRQMAGALLQQGCNVEACPIDALVRRSKESANDHGDSNESVEEDDIFRRLSELRSAQGQLSHEGERKGCAPPNMKAFSCHVSRFRCPPPLLY